MPATGKPHEWLAQQFSTAKRDTVYLIQHPQCGLRCSGISIDRDSAVDYTTLLGAYWLTTHPAIRLSRVLRSDGEDPRLACVCSRPRVRSSRTLLISNHAPTRLEHAPEE